MTDRNGEMAMINAISKVTLYVNNQEEAKAFWTEKVGFEVRSEEQMGPDMKWIEVGPDHNRICTV